MANTRHTCNGGRGPTFGRLSPKTCSRCFELQMGAPRCEGWGGSKRADEAQRIREIAAHDCRRSGCLPICTFGDW